MATTATSPSHGGRKNDRKIKRVMLPPHIASELVRSLEEGVADGENEVVVLIDNRNKPIGVVVTINEFNLTEKLYEIVDNPNQVVRSIFGGGERSKGLTFEQVFGQR